LPTYDYECKKCGHKFDIFQSITAEEIKKCPSCKKNKVKRLITFSGTLIIPSDVPIYKRYQRGTLRKHRAELKQKYKEENKI
jgi:putative FmdB family regulatory protein